MARLVPAGHFGGEQLIMSTTRMMHMLPPGSSQLTGLSWGAEHGWVHLPRSAVIIDKARHTALSTIPWHQKGPSSRACQARYFMQIIPQLVQNIPKQVGQTVSELERPS